MYCIHCGVKLADTEKCCPLCNTKVYHPQLQQAATNPLFPVHRYPNVQVSPMGVRFVVAVLFLLPILITLQCDLLISGGVTWSGYVICSLLALYVIVVLPSWFRRPNPVIFVPCDFAAVAGLLLYIDLATEGCWFLSFAFPVVGFVGLIVTAVVTLMRYVPKAILYIFGGAFCAFGLFMPVMELLLVITFASIQFVWWSVYPLTGLVLLGGTLLFLAICRPARETMERKFFI